MADKPLSGITVLDLTRYLAGPYCTLLLGGLGAEVIKVESPGRGDPHRSNPPFVGPEGCGYRKQLPEDVGLTHIHRGRNKQSITLNLRVAEGKALFLDLCRQADVVVENFSPGVLDNMGIAYETLKAVNPKLILCSISGFGQTGPLREWRAYDPVIQAMSGIASVTGYPDRPPIRCGAAVSDVVAPLFGVIGVLAALRRRDTNGAGEWVDVAMLDTSAFLLPEVLEYFNGGLIPQRRGNDHAAGTPLNTYPTRDGYVTVAVASDKDWGCLLTVLGREDLVGDERFTDRLTRREHIADIEEMVSTWMAERTSDDAVNVLQAHQIAAGSVQSLQEMTDSVQLQARDMIVELSHPSTGPITGTKGFGMPIRFTDNPLSFDQPAAELGAHNEEVYGRLLGLGPEAIAELRQKDII